METFGNFVRRDHARHCKTFTSPYLNSCNIVSALSMRQVRLHVESGSHSKSFRARHRRKR